MNKYRILVVEDEALIAASLVHALSSLGYTVLEPVATGEDAIRAVKTQKPDLVLMDIVLIGEMDGIVAAEKIRAIAEIPIVYLTAYTDDLRLKQAMLTEPYGYIVKPAFTRELNATIEMAMYKHALDRKLKESEETFKALAENANDGILVAVAGGVHIYANQRAGEITGYSIAELLKTCIKDLAAPEEVKKLMERFRKRLSGEDVPHQYETVIIRKDGKSEPIEFSAAKTFWHGQPADLVIIRDITERKRAEDLLREEQQFSRSILDSLPGIFYLYTYPEHKLKRWNKLHETLFGYTAEEMKDRSATDWHLPEFKDAVLKATEMVMEKGQSSVESTLLAKDGHAIPFFLTGVRFEAKGQLYYLGIGIDITERKRAEEQLKHFNEELESQVRSRTVELERLNILLRDEVIQRTGAEERVLKSLKERELLLREVHHRVRNNLQIMLSLIRLQSQNIKDPRLLDTMGDFQNRIRAMAHVHERMYHADDISRIDLSEICTFLGTSLFKSYKVDPQHIRLNVEMKDLQVGIDYAIPISLIINELLSNAIKHAFPHGTSGEITIAGRREADTLVLSVRDTGIGIPKDLDWKRNTQSLGHRLVVSLVEQLNGTVELDRTTGTAFNIVVKEKP